MTADRAARLRELTAVFLKLGTIGFGGPAAHLALMEEEAIRRRGWVSQEEFVDLLGLTNLIPGPNSTEMAMHLGHRRAGAAGLVVAGLAFILPAVVITAGLAWLYVRYGARPEVIPFTAGIRPALVAVVITATWRLGKVASKGWNLVVIGTLVLVSSLAGVSEILALLGAGLLGLAWHSATRRTRPDKSGSLMSAMGFPLMGPAAAAVLAGTPSLGGIGLFFLKIGSVLYGSGYVLIAFLEDGLVRQRHWLTHARLLDAVAIGQFTPGPVLSTATFVGYLLRGPSGAAVATAGIFLPSFVFVALSAPLAPAIRRSPAASAFLDAVNVAAVALLVAVTLELVRTAVVDWRTALIALVAAIAGLRWKVGAAWLILGGGVSGWLLARIAA
ncbi:MAG: chromate efflux transporter [Gemmatimonadota bacterium]